MAQAAQLSTVIESSEPHFINCQFDIKKTGPRDRFRRQLIALGGVMDTYSNYYMKYSAQLVEEILKHKARYPTDKIKIRLPAYDPSSYLEYLQEYEQSFLYQFDELQMMLDRLDGELRNDPESQRPDKKDSKLMRDWTAREIMSQIRHAESIMSDLERGIAKRIEYEQKEYKENPAKYKNIERTLSHQRSHLALQKESCKRRAMREGN